MVSGRFPKASAIKDFEGNPGGKKGNPNEPKPEALQSLEVPEWLKSDFSYYADPDKPVHHEKLVAYVWDKLAPILHRLKVIRNIDEMVFGRYCDTLARWMLCKAFLDKHGSFYPVYSQHWETKETGIDPDTGKKVHQNVPVKVLKSMEVFPQVAMYKDYTNMLRKYEIEFGIGAAARARLAVDPELDNNPLTNGGEGTVPNAFDYANQRKLQAVK